MCHATGQRRLVSRAVAALAWSLTVALLGVALLRVVCYDACNLLTCLNAFTRYIYLPAYPCMIYALRCRRPSLAAANAALVSCHLVWLAPDFIRDRRSAFAPTNAAEDQAAAVHVRILFANVWNMNPEFAAFLREIEETNPDVVVLAEFPWAWREPFQNSPVMAKYIYGHGYKPWRFEQVVVYSRLPLRAEYVQSVSDRVVQFLDVAVGQQTLHLVGLHAPRPTSVQNDDYAQFWKALTPRMLESPHPLVVVGDFNATQYSRVYNDFKAAGLRSAHEVCGRGYATTWPNGWPLIPPIRIDQAFLSGDVACQGISEGVGTGSDHKPLILDVRIPSAPAESAAPAAETQRATSSRRLG